FRPLGGARPFVAAKLDTPSIASADYLVKPFSLNELEARVRALLRRSHHTDSPWLRRARLSFDTVSRTVTIDDVSFELSAREVSLLEALFVHFGQIVSKERLLEHVYGNGGDVG